MHNCKRKLLLLLPLMTLVTTLLSACASPYPLNMNEEQWNKLSADERKTLLLEQKNTANNNA